ncbi:MAG TPA: hypothetical protein VMM76_04015 [Pirellulaceae bacterium]|nr:hypothetical protein [Pirellulaceae bacterium]
MTHRIFFTAVAFITLILASSRAACAEGPDSQFRYFALIAGEAQNDPPPPPDLKDRESHVLVVASGEVHPVLTFAPNAPSDLLAGTTLYDGGTTKHVTRGGIQTLRLLWLDEVPPDHAIALTGPDGDAAFIEAYYVRNAAGSEAGGNTTLWWVDDEPCATCLVLYIGVGLFSK